MVLRDAARHREQQSAVLFVAVFHGDDVIHPGCFHIGEEIIHIVVDSSLQHLNIRVGKVPLIVRFQPFIGYVGLGGADPGITIVEAGGKSHAQFLAAQGQSGGMGLVKITDDLLPPGNIFAIEAGNSGAQVGQRVPGIDFVAGVDEDHRHDRVDAVVGQDSQGILLYAVGKILAAAILDHLHEGHVRPFDIGVVHLEHIKVVHIGKVRTVGSPVIGQMGGIYPVGVRALPAVGVGVFAAEGVFVYGDGILVCPVKDCVGIQLHPGLLRPGVEGDGHQRITRCGRRRLPQHSAVRATHAQIDAVASGGAFHQQAHQGAAVQAVLLGGGKGILQVHLHTHGGNVVGIRLHRNALAHLALVSQLYGLTAGIRSIGQGNRAGGLPALQAGFKPPVGHRVIVIGIQCDLDVVNTKAVGIVDKGQRHLTVIDQNIAMGCLHPATLAGEGVVQLER